MTVGHLLADCDTAHGVGGKVNPPLRPREDVEALWEHVLDGNIDWVVSDHACCKDELKFGDAARRRVPGQVRLRRRGVPAAPAWSARAASAGLSYQRIAELTSRNPADRYGLARPRAHRGRLGRRHRLVDPDGHLDRAGRGLGVHAGVHPVRGLRAHRPGHRHLPAR